MRLRCEGCGATVAVEPETGWPFACPNRGVGDIDHVLRREMIPGRLAAAAPDEHPFLRFRKRLTAYGLARARGWDDGRFVELVRRIDAEVAAVDGGGFAPTSFGPQPRLSGVLGLEPPGAVWVKDETPGVAGSHKGRHLMGILLYLEVARACESFASARRAGHDATRLAIASCGNAALAAAVLARAAHWPLDVFIPPDAEAGIVRRLSALGAAIHVCEREAGATGDPCYRAFHRAIAAGALPFCCQGPDNALTIEGGETLAWEMAATLGGTALDRLFVQVGGGALATALVRGLEEEWLAGGLSRMPRIHTVQTAGAAPLRRAYERVVVRIADQAGRCNWCVPQTTGARAAWIMAAYETRPVQDTLRHAATHRSEFMWPWESAPHSLAHGILDDETYDWLACVEGMLRTGGWPIVVSEDTIGRANELACSTTGVDVTHTGSAGLAGLLALLDDEEAGRDHVARERHGVLFTGARRRSGDPRSAPGSGAPDRVL